MTVEVMNAIRAAEIKRRVDALPTEVEAWIQRSGFDERLKIHKTQVLAIKALMDGLLKSQQVAVTILASDPSFASNVLDILKEVIRAQRIWEFFRSQLSLRFSPDFQDTLWLVDTVAWNCHRTVLEAAQSANILNLDNVREPPLAYVVADISLVTYVRGSAPLDGERLQLGSAVLPIPVIHVPPDQLLNSWELVAVAHEVGHDLETDLGIGAALEGAVKTALTAANRSERLEQWQLWRQELFGDLVALQLMGPAFVRCLRSALMLPERMVTTLLPADEHPTPYIRILIATKFARTIVQPDAANPGSVTEVTQNIADEMLALENDWKALYPDAPAGTDDLLADAPYVFQALMETGLQELKGNTVRSLIPFRASHYLQIRSLAAYLFSNTNYPDPSRYTQTLRHCLSAAQYAVDLPPVGDLPTHLELVDQRTRAFVKASKPAEVRGSQSKSHLTYISTFADRILNERVT